MQMISKRRRIPRVRIVAERKLRFPEARNPEGGVRVTSPVPPRQRQRRRRRRRAGSTRHSNYLNNSAETKRTEGKKRETDRAGEAGREAAETQNKRKGCVPRTAGKIAREREVLARLSMNVHAE